MANAGRGRRSVKRVMLVGGPGAGKSTLARALGAATGLPVYHMDLIHWKPGWEPREMEEKDRMTREIHALDRWILEGGHSRTYADRLARADTLVWIDLPVGLRYWRIFKRYALSPWRSRPDLPENCPERLDWEFWSYIWTSRRRTRARHLKILADPGHLRIHHLTSRRAVARFLREVTEGGPGKQR